MIPGATKDVPVPGNYANASQMPSGPTSQMTTGYNAMNDLTKSQEYGFPMETPQEPRSWYPTDDTPASPLGSMITNPTQRPAGWQ
jgi:hypothetical protein